jgi:hypothetical protein
MNEDIPPSFYPIMLLQDRYGGGYSRGQWIAIRDANKLVGLVSRATWTVEHGPSGDDINAASFWSEPPDWIAVGASPDEAIKALVGGQT